MKEPGDFYALFEEILMITDEVIFLLEDEKNMVYLQKNLESQIQKIHFFLGDEWENMEVSHENIEKIEQLILSVRHVFKEIDAFLSKTPSPLNQGQQTIQAYTQKVLEELSIRSSTPLFVQLSMP